MKIIKLNPDKINSVNRGQEGLKFSAIQDGKKYFFKRLSQEEVSLWNEASGEEIKTPSELAEKILSKLQILQSNGVSIPDFELVKIEGELYLKLSFEGEKGIAFTLNDSIQELLQNEISPWDKTIEKQMILEAEKVGKAGFICVSDAFGIVSNGEHIQGKILDFGAHMIIDPIYDDPVKNDIGQAKKFFDVLQKRTAFFVLSYFLGLNGEESTEQYKLLDNENIKSFFGDEILELDEYSEEKNILDKEKLDLFINKAHELAPKLSELMNVNIGFLQQILPFVILKIFSLYKGKKAFDNRVLNMQVKQSNV